MSSFEYVEESQNLPIQECSIGKNKHFILDELWRKINKPLTGLDWKILKITDTKCVEIIFLVENEVTMTRLS